MQYPQDPVEEDGFDQEEQTRLEQEKLVQKLANLSESLTKMREEAVKGRAESGIESEWLEDEDYYEGIDDANRAEKLVKPTSPDGRVRSATVSRKKTNRSTVFVNITRPYVDAAAARVSDMLLPTDDSNWSAEKTPIPELVAQLDNNALAQQPPVNQMLLAQPVAQQFPQQDQQQQPITVSDIYKQKIKQAEDACEKGKKQIEDWLTECQYNSELRLVIDDVARMGTGVIKGPYPENVKRRAVVRALQGIGVVIEEKIVPRSRRIDPWNFYPDPACGELIQNGKYVWEYDQVTARQLKELKGVPGYFESQIDQVIETGPKNTRSGEYTRPQKDKASDKEMYDIWYGHCYITGEELNLALDLGAITEDQQEQRFEDEEQYPAIVTMVNDVVIKATLSQLDSGEFPYDVMIWQRRAGHWAGIGVGRQMRTSQDGVNAATRAMMDNAGLSSGPIIIVNRDLIEPVEGDDWTIGPRKVFLTRKGVDVTNVRDAITWINITALQQELMEIIQFWMQRAEDETGLPMLLQGQMGRAPDTFGGMQMLSNNATGVLRRIARTFDDRITVPHIGRYYEYLLLHGEDNSAKGDFTIKARGSSALVERDAHAQFLMQIMGLAMNPAYGVDPEKVMAEVLKSQRFNADNLSIDEQKKKAMQDHPPTDPRIAVAGMNAQLKDKAIAATLQGKQMDLQADAQENERQRSFQAQMRDREMAFEAQQNDIDRALEQWEKQLDAQIENAKLRGDLSMNSDDLKVALVRDVQKLRTQMKLAAQNGPQVLTPPTEPPGRAPNGQAFQR